MKFQRLRLKGWRQFAEIDIEFHPRITIITGANGAGKSTMLNVLSQHFGWSQPLLSTPTSLSESGVMGYFTGLFHKLLRKKEDAPTNTVGSIQYSNDVMASVIVPENSGVSYNLQISNQQSIPGLHINSHRPIQTYQQIGNIPTNAINAEQAYAAYHNETVIRYQGSHSGYSPTYRMKEAIISMATFGPGNQYVKKNPPLEKLFLDFKEILTKVLPPTVGFLDISIRIPDVVIVTETGEFMIDAASGGLMSIIGLAWELFLFSHNKEEFTVTIDEPENHLHPSMQRSLLRRLIEAFPKAQFVIVTHSPFIVSSVKDSFVYVLQYDDSGDATETIMNRRISSVKLDTIDKAGTASEILRDVLGVPVTLPEWAEDELRLIAKGFSIQAINSQMINLLRQKLDTAGLGEYYPDALRIMADSK
jgi:energy-coupling factor transporter ATP-binding protein EcfA2